MVALTIGLSLAFAAGAANDPDLDRVRAALTFHAGFDDSFDAGFSKGDRRLYTAGSSARADAKPGNHRSDLEFIEDGRFGRAIRFGSKAKEVVFFEADRNVSYRKEAWSGTVSLWLRLNPEVDLQPGYADPIQITDKKWNDAAFFLDFTKDEKPRHFRLGAFSDYAFWNPRDIKWEKFPVDQRPMVVVERPPFSRDHWTHISYTFSDFNSAGEKGRARLYLNGELQGMITKSQRMTWDAPKAGIMLGLSYIGDFDDLAVFDRALTDDEIRTLYRLEGGVASLYEAPSSK